MQLCAIKFHADAGIGAIVLRDRAGYCDDCPTIFYIFALRRLENNTIVSARARRLLQWLRDDFMRAQRFFSFTDFAFINLLIYQLVARCEIKFSSKIGLNFKISRATLLSFYIFDHLFYETSGIN